MTTSIYTTSHFNAFKANFDKIAEEIIIECAVKPRPSGLGI